MAGLAEGASVRRAVNVSAHQRIGGLRPYGFAHPMARAVYSWL